MSFIKNSKLLLPRIFKLIISIVISIFFIVGLLRILMIAIERNNVFSLETSPQSQVALVLGAGLSQNSTPSTPLQDRIDTAIILYNTGKVSKLLMSGDNRFDYYNEPEAMKLYALSEGIPEDDIVLDYAGRRTYDSCYRAKAIFGLDEVIIVTQNYHLSRALFICNQLNLKAYGVPSDNAYYLRNRYLFWRIREIAASLTAYWDIYVSKPLPVLGKFEPIFPSDFTQ